MDGIFFAFAGDFWDGLSAEQQELVREAAAAAIRFNNLNRIRQEAQLLAFFEEQGMTITTPDVDAFRSHVQQMYLESDYSSDWPEGLIDRINAVK